MRAALAQSVERRLGKAEVGGSIPLGSLFIKILSNDKFERIFLMKKRNWKTKQDINEIKSI